MLSVNSLSCRSVSGVAAVVSNDSNVIIARTVSLITITNFNKISTVTSIISHDKRTRAYLHYAKHLITIPGLDISDEKQSQLIYLRTFAIVLHGIVASATCADVTAIEDPLFDNDYCT